MVPSAQNTDDNGSKKHASRIKITVTLFSIINIFLLAARNREARPTALQPIRLITGRVVAGHDCSKFGTGNAFDLFYCLGYMKFILEKSFVSPKS